MSEQQIEAIRDILRKAIADIVSNIRKMIDKIFNSLMTLYSTPKRINLIKHKEHKDVVLYKLKPQVINRKPKYTRCRNCC